MVRHATGIAEPRTPRPRRPLVVIVRTHRAAYGTRGEMVTKRWISLGSFVFKWTDDDRYRGPFASKTAEVQVFFRSDTVFSSLGALIVLLYMDTK